MIEKMSIGKVARSAGVGVETVRFYERKGLIDQPPKPTLGGHRDYPMETVEKIRFIRQAQEIGFSLHEIGDLLFLRADPQTDCSKVRDRARIKLAEVERKMAHLDGIRSALTDLIAACPGEGTALKVCSIIQSFEGVEADISAPRQKKEPKT